jgi:hypothetical protein
VEFNEKQEQLLKFLDKNYLIKDDRFFTKYDDVHEWGAQISYGLSKIFSHDQEFCVMQLKYWSELNGLEEEEWNLAYGPRKLKAQWSVEMAQDLQMQCGFDAEEQLTSILATEIAREIDSDILRKLKGGLKKSDDLLGVLRCIGYETTPEIVNPHTFKPYKGFVSMNYNDIKNERKTNSLWKDWIRTREQDKKT